jgi:uncharacterized RDD family membrane protein YckC
MPLPTGLRTASGVVDGFHRGEYHNNRDPMTSDNTIPASTTPVYAGFWRRLAAFWLDCFIVFIPMYYSILFIARNEMETAAVWLGPASVALWWAYKAGLEASPLQATFGEMRMGIRICDMQGQRISLGRASGRFVIWFMTAFLMGLPYIVAAFTPKRQAIHDLIASTLVIKA